ncbi:MAG: phosphoribosylaminoimidazolesuccinocarboxamide synthase [Patescibacteria group bacterium]|nr:phosphoribosylaminoimidazolesuccinocarboxamide synthase [Patescibacteria group bacterium]MDD4611102.1 phosphoribosylaminoimidazolesuccinocarboxamide synthase [Patescibacteria group bacterium]
MIQPLFETNFPGLPVPRRGKVRDIYDLGDFLLMVATDRLSAFDVVMKDPIPGKGITLTQMTLFWLEMFADMVLNHLVTADPAQYPDICKPYADILVGRSMLVKKCAPLPVECIVRGYLSGSGWNDYKKTGCVCGIQLPPGLLESAQLPEPIFTPSTKAEQGKHDENILFEQAVKLLSRETAEKIQKLSLALYQRAAAHARRRGIIIADTKFEFGLDKDGNIVLIDEVLTSDSSRFWPAAQYEPGHGQPSFDKQGVRDFLVKIGWDKKPPAPKLPIGVIAETREKYLKALRLLTGQF